MSRDALLVGCLERLNQLEVCKTHYQNGKGRARPASAKAL